MTPAYADALLLVRNMMSARMMCQLKMQYGAALLHLYFDVIFLCVVFYRFLIVCNVV